MDADFDVRLGTRAVTGAGRKLEESLPSVLPSGGLTGWFPSTPGTGGTKDPWREPVPGAVSKDPPSLETDKGNRGSSAVYRRLGGALTPQPGPSRRGVPGLGPAGASSSH